MRATRALDLAKQLGARRFQAECTGILAATALGLRNREDAFRLARESVQISRDTGMSYCGPVLLSLVARTTDDAAERAKALQEGEELLAAGCVSHSYFNFYMHAIEVSLEQRQWSEARRYASSLEAYTSTEPLPFTSLLIRRGRLLADVGEGLNAEKTRAELEDLRSECLRINARTALAAIDAALAEPAAA
jgi:hypothetical protein